MICEGRAPCRLRSNTLSRLCSSWPAIISGLLRGDINVTCRFSLDGEAKEVRECSGCAQGSRPLASVHSSRWKEDACEAINSALYFRATAFISAACGLDREPMSAGSVPI